MKIKERAQKVWGYAKEHPVKALLIGGGLIAGGIGITAAVRNHNHDDDFDEDYERLPASSEEEETESSESAE